MSVFHKGFVLFASMAAGLGNATEALDLLLRAQVKYSDAHYSCDTGRLGVDFFVTGKIDRGDLISLKLFNHTREWAFQWVYQEVLLPAPVSASGTSVSEVVKLEGQWWFKKIETSEAFLKWVLNVGLSRSVSCQLRKQVLSAKASKAAVEFELGDIPSGVAVSYSDRFEVSGIGNDKEAYQAKIRFIQRSPHKRTEAIPGINRGVNK